MNNKIRRLGTLILVIIMLLSMNNIAAVVTDNDASGFVTKAEFEAFKANVQYQVDLYNNNLNANIDGAIATYLANLPGAGSEAEVLDKVFPIGYVLVASQPPQLGTWEEITDATGRALYLGDGATTWGQTDEQKMPNLPTFTTSTEKHSHTFTGTRAQTSSDGQHRHTATVYIKDNSTQSRTRNDDVVSQTSTQTISLSHDGPHTHTITPTGTINSVNHSHTVSFDAANDPVYKNGNTKVQPNAYVIKMWKRTA